MSCLFRIEHAACCVCLYPERAVPLRLNYSKYGDQLTDDSLIRLAVLLLDYSTREPVLAVRTIVLKDPEIKVRVSEKAARRQTPPFAGCSLKCFSSVGCVLQVLGEPKQNRRLAAEITLQNPLPEPLQDCCFRIEGANLTGGRVISERFAESGLLFVRVTCGAFSWTFILFSSFELVPVRELASVRTATALSDVIDYLCMHRNVMFNYSQAGFLRGSWGRRQGEGLLHPHPLWPEKAAGRLQQQQVVSHQRL